MTLSTTVGASALRLALKSTLASEKCAQKGRLLQGLAKYIAPTERGAYKY
jgi:hypothetical protein